MVPWNGLLFGLSGILLGLGAIKAYRSIKGIRSFYTSLLQEQREKLSEAQRHAFGIGAKHFFEDFVTLFEPLRTVCKEHRDKYQPQIDKIEACEKRLAELESILTPIAKMLDSRGK